MGKTKRKRPIEVLTPEDVELLIQEALGEFDEFVEDAR